MTDKRDAPVEEQPQRPSQTAGFTTFCRVCVSKERNEQLRGSGYVAKVFPVGWPRLLLAPFRIAAPMARRLSTKNWLPMLLPQSCESE